MRHMRAAPLPLASLAPGTGAPAAMMDHREPSPLAPSGDPPQTARHASPPWLAARTNLATGSRPPHTYHTSHHTNAHRAGRHGRHRATRRPPATTQRPQHGLITTHGLLGNTWPHAAGRGKPQHQLHHTLPAGARTTREALPPPQPTFGPPLAPGHHPRRLHTAAPHRHNNIHTGSMTAQHTMRTCSKAPHPTPRACSMRGTGWPETRGRQTAAASGTQPGQKRVARPRMRKAPCAICYAMQYVLYVFVLYLYCIPASCRDIGFRPRPRQCWTHTDSSDSYGLTPICHSARISLSQGSSKVGQWPGTATSETRA
jgi:hypothetical protein